MTDHRPHHRSSYTLVELVIAVSIGAVVVWGGILSVRYFARPAALGEVTIDQINYFQIGAEKLDHDLREARSVIYPMPDGVPARTVFLRNFDGRIVVYYYCQTRRELRRVLLDPGGLPVEDSKPPVANIDGAYFSVTPARLISWGLFAPDMLLLGSVKVENR
jgi:hypothetical protein